MSSFIEHKRLRYVGDPPSVPPLQVYDGGASSLSRRTYLVPSHGGEDRNGGSWIMIQEEVFVFIP